MKKELFVAGSPSKLGGADTELLANCVLWRMFDVEVHIVPMGGNDLYVKQEMEKIGCIYHNYHPAIFKDKNVISYCNGVFLSSLKEIMQLGKPRKILWANCVPSDAIISGKNTTIADNVNVGDLIYGHDGKLHKVKNKNVKQFNDELINFTTAGLPSIRVTPDHRMLVLEKWEFFTEEGRYSDKPKWKRADEIVKGEYLLVPKIINTIKTPDFQDEYNKNIKWKPKMKICKEVAWLFGVFVADGYAEKNHRISICLSNSEHVSKAVDGLIKLGVQPNVIHFPKHTIVNANSAILANAFLEWFGCGSENKHLPSFVFNGEWNLESIAEGLLAGDGCKIRREVRLSTVSRALMQQVFQIAVNLGKRPTVYIQKRSRGVYKNAKPLFVIRWVLEPKKYHQTRWTDEYYCLPVVSINKEKYHGKVIDFEVEDSHSFLSDGVVAHNCMTFLFPLEIEAHKNKWIDKFIFVSDFQKSILKPQLEKYNPVDELEGYKPYFDPNNVVQQIAFNYREPKEWFAVGRISRDDGAKYSSDMWSIFNKVCVPKKKKVFILGYGPNAKKKCGIPPNGLDWQTWEPNAVPIKQLYNILHAIIHKVEKNCRESYCRIVPECFGFGVPIIAENNYAFPTLIENGVTGYLCDSSDEMSYRASELAFNEQKRKNIIYNAYDYLINEIANKGKCWQPWKRFFEE